MPTDDSSYEASNYEPSDDASFDYDGSSGQDLSPPRRAPRWWISYLVGSLLLVFGIILPCGGLFAVFVTLDPASGVAMPAPGSVVVPISTVQPMIIWVQEPHLPGAQDFPVVPDDIDISVKGAGGQPILVRAPQVTHGYVRDARRTAAGFFDPPVAGDYTVSVRGTFKPTQLVAISQDDLSKQAAEGIGAMASLLVGALLLIAGLVTLVVTIIRQIRHPKLIV